MSEILVLGSRGQLGTELVKILAQRGASFEAMDKEEMDITDEKTVVSNFERLKPRTTINTAAFTDVEGCETNNHEASAVNSLGARNVALAALRTGGRVIHISTDYVFDGNRETPYPEYTGPSPINFYGSSKARGEGHVLSFNPEENCIVRTATLFGIAKSRIKRTNCIENLLRAAQRDGPLTAIKDQKISVTYARHLAEALVKLAYQRDNLGRVGGIYHLVNEGTTTWYELAREVVRRAGLNKEVFPISLDEWNEKYPSAVKRPRNSSLMNVRAAGLGISLPDWRDGVDEYFAEKELKRAVA